MSRTTAFVLAALVSLFLSGQTHAQAIPPAGSAGAGNSAISGVPNGPANPRALSDPSGIGNAGNMPPLRSNVPATVVNSYPAGPTTRPVRAPAPIGGSSRIVSTHAVEPRGKTPPRRRSRPEVSHFTGICRGC